MNKQIVKYSALALGLALVTSPYVAAEAQKVLTVDQIDKAREAYYAKLKAKPWGQVAEKYIKQLTKEEEALGEQLCTLAGFTSGTYKRNMEHLKKRFQDFASSKNEGCCGTDCDQLNGDEQPANAKIKKLVVPLLKECGLDPAYVTLYMQTNRPLSDYLVDGLVIANPENISDAYIKADALQAIMHMMHYDRFTRLIMHFGFFGEPDNSANAHEEDGGERVEEQLDAIAYQLIVHIDKRSDALAALVSLEYASQLIARLKDEKQIVLNVIKNSYIGLPPTAEIIDSSEMSEASNFYDERIAFLETIYKEMLACQ